MKQRLLLILLLVITGCAVKSQPVSKQVEKEEVVMKLYINDQEVPVQWENEQAVQELNQQVQINDIAVELSKYSNNEQVGSLGRGYTTNDSYMTTSNGDIVLYCGNQIVVFYAPNTWSYTKLGRMKLDSEQVVDLLSNEDVMLTLKKD